MPTLDEILEQKSKVEKKEIKKKEKEISVFDYIKQIDNKSNELVFDKKKCSTYILLLHYSHDNMLLNLINSINKYSNIVDNEYIYQYLFYKIPKKKRFIKWIKKDKVKSDKIQKLMDEYNISYREASESLI